MPGNIFKLRPKAAKDLEDIYFYSVEKWGIPRADTYIKDINNAFNQLIENSGLGRDYGDVRPNLLAYFVGSHIIFYKFVGRDIAVVRVLHQSMDFKRHL